jgi:hypothetical protein
MSYTILSTVPSLHFVFYNTYSNESIAISVYRYINDEAEFQPLQNILYHQYSNIFTQLHEMVTVTPIPKWSDDSADKLIKLIATIFWHLHMVAAFSLLGVNCNATKHNFSSEENENICMYNGDPQCRLFAHYITFYIVSSESRQGVCEKMLRNPKLTKLNIKRQAACQRSFKV